MGRILGIDLGTTNSVMAIMDGDTPQVLINDVGDRITPSVVSFANGDEVLVGKKARRAAALNVDRSVFSIKRKMGTKFRVNIDGREYTPQELSSFILQKLKSDAEAYLHEELPDAVVTVPAYFTDAQRQATRDAGVIAGFNVRRIIDEPTAAAISYGLDKETDQVLMVFDLGGGTFDVSIIEMVGGVFQVLGIKGNNQLGGDDFDDRIVEFLLEHIKETEGIDLSEDRKARFRLRDAAQEAKIELSAVTKTQIIVEALAMTEKGPISVDVELTRAKLEALIHDLIESMRGPTETVIRDAGLTPPDISNVLLVGGSTRMPCVQALVKGITHKDPRKDVSPDECVAMGAAIQGTILAPEIGGGESGTQLNTDGPVIVHLTPFSLGVGLAEDRFGILIERNSTYPTEAKDLFTTTRDFQDAISFPVYEGEEPVASANTFLDMLRISEIPASPRGVPRIEVTFRLNQDRILEATAKDLTTGQEVSVTILSTDNRLDAGDVESLKAEARERVALMLHSREMADLQNEAEGLIYRAEKMFEEFASMVTDDARVAVDRLREAKDSGDDAALGDLMGTVSEMLTKLEMADY